MVVEFLWDEDTHIGRACDGDNDNDNNTNIWFGLVLGTAFIVYARPGKSLRTFDFHGITLLAEDTNEVQILIVIRGFKADHSDFERSGDKDPALPVKGLVESTLSSGRKPVYMGGYTIDANLFFYFS